MNRKLKKQGELRRLGTEKKSEKKEKLRKSKEKWKRFRLNAKTEEERSRENWGKRKRATAK